MHHFPETTDEYEGYDTSGNPVRLGDTDSDGYYVGYIAYGLAYESHEAAECTLLENRYLEAYREWRAHTGPCPSLDRMARELVSERNRIAAMKQAHEGLMFWMRLQRARWRTRFPATEERDECWNGYALS